MPENFSIEKTGDGSDTLFSAEFNQPYHNRAGAVEESRYIFFESTGLDRELEAESNLNILEIGFGTGLNLILLLDYLQKANNSAKVNFFSVEAFPISPEIASTIRFENELDDLDYNSILNTIFSDLKSGWNSFEISNRVTLHLFLGEFREMKFEASSEKSTAASGENVLFLPINFVMHDPFSPESNPAGWTPKLFSKIAKASASDAMLSTYSAASLGRAAMASAGWKVARAPGALRKREMTVASLNPDRLSHLKRVNEERLAERLKAGDFD